MAKFLRQICIPKLEELPLIRSIAQGWPKVKLVSRGSLPGVALIPAFASSPHFTCVTVFDLSHLFSRTPV